MPIHTVEFQFNLCDKVILKEIQRPGVIDLLQLDNLGKMYRVAYWDDAERKTVWLYADEIAPR